MFNNAIAASAVNSFVQTLILTHIATIANIPERHPYNNNHSVCSDTLNHQLSMYYTQGWVSSG